MGFVTTKPTDLLIKICILVLFVVINLPRFLHILKTLSNNHPLTSSKHRIACNWFDLGFIITGLLFMMTSFFLTTNTTGWTSYWNGNQQDCITLICISLFLYITSTFMILLFLRNRVILFVLSGGTWIKFPKGFNLYPILATISTLAYIISLILFTIRFNTKSSSFECDTKHSEQFLYIFLPSTILLSLTYCFDLLTFSCIVYQCRSIVHNIPTTAVVPQTANSIGRASVNNVNKRINKMVWRLLKPALLLAMCHVATLMLLLILNTSVWQLVANVNFIFVSICVLFMYRHPSHHLKAIFRPCKTMLNNESPQRNTLLNLLSPTKIIPAFTRSMSALPHNLLVKISIDSLPKMDQLDRSDTDPSKSDTHAAFEHEKACISRTFRSASV
eukprot:789689_1